MAIRLDPFQRIVEVGWPSAKPVITSVEYLGDPENGYFDWTCPDGNDRYVLNGGYYVARSFISGAGQGVRWFGAAFLWPLGRNLTLVQPAGVLRSEDALYIADGAKRRISGVDFGADEGEVYLSDDQDWETGTRVQQTVDAWGDGQIDIDVARGALDEGTVYLWVVTSGGKRSAPFGSAVDVTERLYIYDEADASSTLQVVVNFLHTGTETRNICGGGTFAVLDKRETAAYYTSGPNNLTTGIITG